MNEQEAYVSGSIALAELERLIGIVGTQSEAARAIGVDRQRVWAMRKDWSRGTMARASTVRSIRDAIAKWGNRA